MESGQRIPGRRHPLAAFLRRLAMAAAGLDRHRGPVALATAALFATIAASDRWVWPDVSLALAYAFPIGLASYVFGLRAGAALSVAAVATAAFLGGPAPWPLARDAIVLAQYLVLAVAAGLLGDAIRLNRRHEMQLRCLADVARELVDCAEDETMVRRAVEAAVELTGATGGFVATGSRNGWTARDVFVDGEWSVRDVVWWRDVVPPWELPDGRRDDAVDAHGEPWSALELLDAALQLGAPIPDWPGASGALVVFREADRPFEAFTRELFASWALQVSAALRARNGEHGATRLQDATHAR
jgi:hypothetical protein